MPKPRKEVDLVQLQKDINAQTWRKTNVRGGPHEYFIRCQNPSLWDRLAQLVKEKGVRQLYPQTGRKYRYYYHTDGYRYWHFLVVMNRSKIPKSQVITVSSPASKDDPFVKLWQEKKLLNGANKMKVIEGKPRVQKDYSK